MKLLRWFGLCTKTVCLPVHLKKTGLTTAIVGSWLSALNQGENILSHQFSHGIWVKILLNFFTPFVVANIGLLSHSHNPGRAIPTNSHPPVVKGGD
ncbi:MAG: hypothetical protein VST70_07965 [Nitrospirota bacterium]|nr:hypothetical protein [Nitrospirota bacterium]